MVSMRTCNGVADEDRDHGLNNVGSHAHGSSNLHAKGDLHVWTNQRSVQFPCNTLAENARNDKLMRMDRQAHAGSAKQMHAS
jgi:hypothetical protein